MKMIIFTVFMAVLVGLAFFVVFINRESEKIVSAAVPLAFAAFAALALVFAFAREEPMTRVFPVSFYYQLSDKLPVVIPRRPFPQILHLVDQLRQQDSKALDEAPNVQPGILVYHEFLQKGLIEWIALRHFGTWRMELLRFESAAGTEEHFQPLPDATAEASKILSAEELQQNFASNRFARVHTGFGTLALPPGTSLEVETPKAPAAQGQIRFKNWFCQITIRTSPGLSRSGVGAYPMLLGFDPFEPPVQGYSTGQYIVRITATFSPVLIGHPRMALVKRWATGILDGLQHEFDEQVVWRRTVENHMFARHLPDPIKGDAMPLRTMRFTTPQVRTPPGNATIEKKPGQ